MNWQQKVGRARRIYDQTWVAAAGLYGAKGQPAPKAEYVRSTPLGMAAETYQEEGGPATVQLTPRAVRMLAAPKKMIPGGKQRARGRTLLLHEWAHAFQNPTIYNDPNVKHTEEAAELFATYWGHKLFGAPVMQKGGPLPYAGRKQGSRDLAATYGKGYWRRRQFSAY